MYCTKCGACIPDDVIACPQCGCATKNYHPEQPHYQRSTPRREVSQETRERNADTRKIIVGVFLMLIGANWFCTGIASGRIWILVVGLIMLIGASSLIAWGAVNRKAASKKKDCAEEYTRE